MLSTEKIAIAAHLHVLLRRKTGRVTDTEWMACNEEYAAEIVRFARHSARTDGHTDLGEWAEKLEVAMIAPVPTKSLAQRLLEAASSAAAAPPPEALPTSHRYVRGIR